MIRQVLDKLSDDEFDRGLHAFEDGASNWSRCFFAQALPHLRLNTCADPERVLMIHFNFKTYQQIRAVWQTFDGMGQHITRAEMVQFMQDVRDQRRPDELMQLLRNVGTVVDEGKMITVEGSCDA